MVVATPATAATAGDRLLLVDADPDRLRRLAEDVLGELDVAAVLSTTDPAVGERWLREAGVSCVVVGVAVEPAAGAERLLRAAARAQGVRTVRLVRVPQGDEGADDAGAVPRADAVVVDDGTLAAETLLRRLVEADEPAAEAALGEGERAEVPPAEGRPGEAQLAGFLRDLAMALIGVATRETLERATFVEAMGSGLFRDVWLVTYRPETGEVVVGGSASAAEDAVRPTGTLAAVEAEVRWALFTDEWTAVEHDGATVVVLPVVVGESPPTAALLYADRELDESAREVIPELQEAVRRARAGITARAEVPVEGDDRDLAEIAFAEVVRYEVGLWLEQARGAVERAREGGERYHLAKLDAALVRIEDLVETERRVAGGAPLVVERTPEPVNAVARAAWGNVPTERATLQVLSSATVAADHELLLRLFEHLFRNAVAHGGPAVTVRVRVEGDALVVEDDGPGIPESTRERVFSWGFSTTGGEGYGLAIVERIAVAHGWTVTAGVGGPGGAGFTFESLERADGD